MTEEQKLEVVAVGGGITVRRFAVPGGWLYLSRTKLRVGAGPDAQTALASTFVPDPNSGGADVG